jgi:hypothetical protein
MAQHNDATMGVEHDDRRFSKLRGKLARPTCRALLAAEHRDFSFGLRTDGARTYELPRKRTKAILAAPMTDLPPDVRDFISRHVVALEELEVLLLLYHERARPWTITEINDRLRSQESSIAKWLEVLTKSDFVRSVDGHYQLVTPNETVRQQIAGLAEAYRTRRTKVIEFIFSKPNETLLSFVRAFDLRKRP